MRDTCVLAALLLVSHICGQAALSLYILVQCH